jgi:hypothetical protein
MDWLLIVLGAYIFGYGLEALGEVDTSDADDAARKADEEFSKRKREARGNAHPRDVFKDGKWRRWKG